jgi:hypothetical protein
MLDRVKEAQLAAQSARSKVYAVLEDASRRLDAPQIVCALTGAQHALQAAEFLLLYAVDAARGYEYKQAIPPHAVDGANDAG